MPEIGNRSFQNISQVEDDAEDGDGVVNDDQRQFYPSQFNEQVITAAGMVLKHVTRDKS